MLIFKAIGIGGKLKVVVGLWWYFIIDIQLSLKDYIGESNLKMLDRSHTQNRA